jgi:hypothetical protein
MTTKKLAAIKSWMWGRKAIEIKGLGVYSTGVLRFRDRSF